MTDDAALLAAEIAAWAEPVLCHECGGTGRIETVREGFRGEPIFSDYRCDECEDGRARCAHCDHTPAFLLDPSYDRACQECLAADLDPDEDLRPWRDELTAALSAVEALKL